jgi:hypothetical protein
LQLSNPTLFQVRVAIRVMSEFALPLPSTF